VNISNTAPTTPVTSNILMPAVPAAQSDTAAQQNNEIIVASPMNGQKINSPVTVTGQARGSWYFEGSFPIALVNGQGAVIASGAAKAEGNWQTDEFVPFSGTLTFLDFSTTTSIPQTGDIILKKDNPSGDPRFDNSVSIKVQW
jgi:hypothetical protein